LKYQPYYYLNDLLLGISVKNDSKRKTKLTVSHLLNAIDSLQGDIIKSDAQVTSDFSKAPVLEYSAVYLESIIQNLLSNALKYSSPHELPKFIFNPNY
jgi:signal transduction histidine kinase